MLHNNKDEFLKILERASAQTDAEEQNITFLIAGLGVLQTGLNRFRPV